MVKDIFLHNGGQRKSTDKVKRNKVIQSVEQGSLAMINTQGF